MKSIKMTRCAIVAVFAVVVLSSVWACSSKDLNKDVSGTWQRSEGEGAVEINLVKEPLSLTLDGKTYPATITKVDDGSYSLHIKVENGAGQTEEWILRQVWNDNGSDYSLAFTHNGKNEKLVSKRHA